MPDHPTYCSQVLDHLGLVAGMFDELGIGDILDQATHQNPEMRDLTVGEAVKAMVLNGLGFSNHALSLVPRFFQHKPTSRLISPRVAPAQLNDDALGRPLDTLYASGVTALYSLIAATAAKRLGLCPPSGHLDTTSFHVDGRSNSDEEPSERVVPITKGSSRAHRPDLNQVMLELIVAHQAGIPVLMQPLRGHSRDGPAFGHIVQDHMAQLHTTYGTSYLVADSALSSAANLQKLAETQIKWLTRVPATRSEAQAALVQADPQTMAPLTTGYRSHSFPATYGGVAQRWMLVYAAHRHTQAQRTVAKQWLKQGQREVAAFQQLCRMTFACEADAQQAFTTFTHGLQATCLHEVAVRAIPRYGKRGRPRQDEQPAQCVYAITGALVSSIAVRPPLVAQQSGCILATNELDETLLPPAELFAG